MTEQNVFQWWENFAQKLPMRELLEMVSGMAMVTYLKPKEDTPQRMYQIGLSVVESRLSELERQAEVGRRLQAIEHKEMSGKWHPCYVNHTCQWDSNTGLHSDGTVCRYAEGLTDDSSR